MSSWDDYRLTCVHGIREGLDSHDCPKCMERAIKECEDVSNGKTYIYTSDPAVTDGQ